MLENAFYCPILNTRVAETKALGQLSSAVKDLLWPVLIARPWPNAKSLSRTWEKIEEAIGGRSFALDLDRTYDASATASASGAEYVHLSNPDAGFKEYYLHLENTPFATPVLQPPLGQTPSYGHQLQRASDLDRGILVRVRFSDTADLTKIFDALAGSGLDVAFLIDAEWSRDLLLREVWVAQTLKAILDALPFAEIAVSGSSFPSVFTDVGKRKAFRVEERILFSQIQRSNNETRVVYSDWGSTRPLMPSTPMTTKPRLDLSLSDQWISFRQEGSEDYQKIGKRMTSDPLWPEKLNIWGTYQIVTTSEGLPGGIRSPIAAAAARINMHLHRQATFGQPGTVVEADEPYED